MSRHSEASALRRDLLVGILEGVGWSGVFSEEAALGIIVATACRIAEGVVGVVYELELAGALGAFW